jgi:hypothetical protein
MSAWNYLKAGFWQRVPLPLLGQVPLNAVAFAGFGIAGFDHPAFWAAGAAWETLWLAGSAGRVGYRRKVDARARRTAWRSVEERRLQLYNQLPPADRQRHHSLRSACQNLIAPRPGQEPDPAAELFTWLHLKLLLARQQAVSGQRPAADPDVPRLHAGAAVEFTDPVRAHLADEAVTMLDPRHGIKDPTLPLLPRIEAALQRIEAELVIAVRLQGKASGPGSFNAMAEAAAGAAVPLTRQIPPLPGAGEVDRLLDQLGAGKAGSESDTTTAREAWPAVDG